MCFRGSVSVKLAGPVLAQDAETKKTIYEQLDLFGDIFERSSTSSGFWVSSMAAGFSEAVPVAG